MKRNNGKNLVSSACTPCRIAHAACSVGRPCKRCITTRREELCIRSITEQLHETSPNHPTQSSQAPFILYTTIDLQVLAVSNSTFNSTGFRPDELSGRKLRQFIHPSDFRAIIEESKDLISQAPLVGRFHSNSDIMASLTLSPESSRAELCRPIGGSYLPERRLRARILHADGLYYSQDLQIYLGGGLGANVWRPETYGHCYLVIHLHTRPYESTRGPQACLSTRSAPGRLQSIGELSAEKAVSDDRLFAFSPLITPSPTSRSNAISLPPLSELESLNFSSSLDLAPFLYES